jgi:hypothetical protein
MTKENVFRITLLQLAAVLLMCAVALGQPARGLLVVWWPTFQVGFR